MGLRLLRLLRRFGPCVVVGALAVAAAGCGASGSTPVAAPKPHAHPHPVARLSTNTAVSTSSPLVPAGTLVATTKGSIGGYAAPGAAAPAMTVPGTWYGYPSELPVITTTRGWLEVRLAQRPNESTTWVREQDVTLANTPYAIVVDLATMHLLVYDDGAQIFDFPAGVGAASDPTPPGQYFVTMQYPPPSPGYGPFVLVTSDHSDSITDWENSGDAIIAIHGPIDAYDDALIGNTGAAISHGCIRLHDADLAQLAMIPPGTPIDIVG
jgi:lipoprotein-anchoring transpeptidase ErfK/SrfK